MSLDDDDTRHVILKLLALPGASSILAAHRWANEADRLQELIVSLMRPVLRLPEGAARAVCTRLRHLQLLDLNDWRASEANPTERLHTRMRRALVEEGVANGRADVAIVMLTELAAALVKQCNGKIQLWLRELGTELRASLIRNMKFTRLDENELHEAGTYWLQNAVNLPLTLSNRDVHAFCDSQELSFDALVKASDLINLNIGVLDDLVFLWAGGMVREGVGNDG
jgi:hypothetical protein